MGIPFKKPYVEEMPPYEKVDDSIETHIEYLDQIVVNLNVLKSGKVRVKILPQMAVLNEKYYSKYKIPPIKSITSALKSIGYSQEFIDSMMVKYKKRNELIEKKWKILEKRFDAPSTASRNKKKKADKKAEMDMLRAQIDAQKAIAVDDRERDALDQELMIKVAEILEAHKNNQLLEMFGAGTAAVVSPISGFGYKGEKYEITPQEDSYATFFKKTLNDIQYNLSPDPYGWRVKAY